MSVEKPAEKAPSNYRTLIPEGRRPPPAPKPVARPAAKPVPAPAAEKAAGSKATAEADPTRFGDWEVNGRCIDF